MSNAGSTEVPSRIVEEATSPATSEHAAALAAGTHAAHGHRQIDAMQLTARVGACNAQEQLSFDTPCVWTPRARPRVCAQ